MQNVKEHAVTYAKQRTKTKANEQRHKVSDTSQRKIAFLTFSAKSAKNA